MPGGDDAAMRALLLLPLLAACAASCPPGLQKASVAELLFGRAIPGGGPGGDGGTVSEAEWQDFLAGTVTPAFPDGLTVQAAEGQWRGADGTVQREAAQRLLLVLPGEDLATAATRSAALAEAYRSRFRQESVLRIHHSACIAF